MKLDPVQKAIAQLGRFPGIGQRTATRMVFWLMQQDPQIAVDIGSALCELPSKIKKCERCYTISTEERCAICTNPNRDNQLICVVERPQDIAKIERTGSFNGSYHVLGGVLSPLEGIGPEDLRIKELLHRLKSEHPTEIVLAVDPDTEGDATSMYLSHILKPLDIRITRIAHGIAVGTEIEYASSSSLRMALENRQEL
jgi:recombination protein RecR